MAKELSISARLAVAWLEVMNSTKSLRTGEIEFHSGPWEDHTLHFNTLRMRILLFPDLPNLELFRPWPLHASSKIDSRQAQYAPASKGTGMGYANFLINQYYKPVLQATCQWKQRLSILKLLFHRGWRGCSHSNLPKWQQKSAKQAQHFARPGCIGSHALCRVVFSHI